MPDTSQIPPQIMQAMMQQQQSGASGPDIGDMLQQLMQMSPDEVATVLQQMGIQVTPEQVHDAAENWVDKAADDASGTPDTPAEETTQADAGEDEASPPDATQSSASAPDNEVAEAAPDDEAEEGELPPNAQPTQQQGKGADPRLAAIAAAQAGGGGMPPRMPSGGPPGIPSAGGGPIDDLISAQMMQRAVGNPNATVPSPKGGIPMPRSASAIPMPRAGGGAPSNQQMSSMIADLYRGGVGGKSGKTRKPSAKPR